MRRFDEALVQRLTRDAGVAPRTSEPDDVYSVLATLAEDFFQARLGLMALPPYRVVKELSGIEESAGRLIKKLEEGRAAHVRLWAQAAATRPRGPDIPSGADRLSAAINSVRDLQRWAKAAAEREARRKGKRKPVIGDPALQALVNGLAEVWLESWERFPAASTNPITGNVSGPFVRFVESFLSYLAETLTAEESSLDPDLKDALTPGRSALKERIQKSPFVRIRKLVKGQDASKK